MTTNLDGCCVCGKNRPMTPLPPSTWLVLDVVDRALVCPNCIGTISGESGTFARAIREVRR